MSRSAALALFVVLAAVFHLDKLLLGPHGLVRLHDTVDSEWPRFVNYGRMALGEGGTTWYPHLAGGLPTYATHHSPWHPLALASALLPPWAVYHLLVLALMALAGYGMFRFAGEVLGAEPDLALLAGVLFALGSQTQWSSLPVAVFSYLFPLFYVLVERGGEPGQPAGWASLAGLAALMAVAYPILTVHFFLVHAMVLVLLDPRGPRLPRLARAVAIWTGYALSCAATLVTLLRFVPLAQRDYLAEPYPAAEILADAARMTIIFLVEHLADGLALPFVFLAVLLAARSPRVRRALAMLLAVMGLSLLGGSKARVLISGTFLRRLDLFHCLRGLPFLGLLLAVVTLQELRARPDRDRALALAVAALGLACLPLGLDPIAAGPLCLMNWGALLLAASAAAGKAGSPGSPSRRRLQLVSGALGLMLAFGGCRLLRLVEERHSWWANLGPVPELAALAEAARREPFRVAGWSVEPELLQMHGLETIDAYGPLYFRRFKQAFRLLVQAQFDSPEARDEFDLLWNQLLLFPRENRGRPRLDTAWLGAMNVRYLVAGEKLAGLPGLRLVGSTAPAQGDLGALGRAVPQLRSLARRGALHLYEVEAWLPRAYLVDRVRVLADGPAVLAALGEADAAELARTAFLEAGESGPLGPSPRLGPPGTVKLSVYEPDRLVLEVATPGASLLMVTDNWHPSWTAEVDGAPAPLLRANHTFQAVPLPAGGTHRVELRFRDPWLPWLHGLALAGFFFMLAAARRPTA